METYHIIRRQEPAIAITSTNLIFSTTVIRWVFQALHVERRLPPYPYLSILRLVCPAKIMRSGIRVAGRRSTPLTAAGCPRATSTGMPVSRGSTCPRMRMGRPGTPDVLRQTAVADGRKSGVPSIHTTAPTPDRRLIGMASGLRTAAGRAPSGRGARG